MWLLTTKVTVVVACATADEFPETTGVDVAAAELGAPVTNTNVVEAF